MRKTFFIPALTILSAALLLLPLTPVNAGPFAERTEPVPAMAADFRGRLVAQQHSADSRLDQQEPEEPFDLDQEPPDITPDIDLDVDMDIDVDVSGVDADRDEPDMPDMPDMDNRDSDLDHDRDRDLDIDIDQPGDIDEPDVDVDSDDSSFSVREQEKIEKSFSLPSGHRALEIDNIWGSIEITGGASDQVLLTVNKTIRAESKDKLEKARKDVTLDITQQADSLKLYVNGPFRCQCNDCRGSREDDGYIVKMDFQLRVPRDLDLQVKTVNEGRVIIRNVNGSFLVRNVNGDIQMDQIGGSGTARTVNGPVKVSFLQNPRQESDFRTVNGNVELRFAPGLAADFRFKTFNGGIYSDFPVTALPVHGIQEEHHGAKVIFRADRFAGARVSSGGPQIKVENLNGDIRILENHE